LSFRLVEPPCVPSRRSSKWRIRLVIYAGIGFLALPAPIKNSVCAGHEQHLSIPSRPLPLCHELRSADVVKVSARESRVVPRSRTPDSGGPPQRGLVSLPGQP
jgi:hypothetical protein